MKAFYTQVEVAPECFLKDALNWIAFCQLPGHIYTIDSEGITLTESDDPFYNGIPNTTYMEYMPEDICKKYGLEISPEDDYLINNKYKQTDSASIYKMLEMPEIEEEQKAKLREELPSAIEYETQYKKFSDSIERYLEIYKIRLFEAIKSGKIKTYARVYSTAEDDENLKCPTYVEVEKNIWRYDNVEWIECSFSCNDFYYSNIKLKTADLLEVFPCQEESEIIPARIMGDYLVVASENKNLPDNPKYKRRGRPSREWDAFYLELFRRIETWEKPLKLEFCVAEMMEWYSKTFKRPIGRSTVVEKIAPFLKDIKKSENT